MRLNNMGGLDGGIQQLELLIQPRSAIAKRHKPHDHVLYLQKGISNHHEGSQVIGRFEPSARNSAHQQIDLFHHCMPVHFRVCALGRSTYTWGLYKVLPTGQEEAQDSTSFNLRRTIQLYQVELVEVVTRIAEQLENNKSKKISLQQIRHLWQRERVNMKTNKAILKAIFPHQNVDMQFEVQIKNGLDVKMEEEQAKHQATMYNYEMRRPLQELDELEQERQRQVQHQESIDSINIKQGEMYQSEVSKGNGNNEVTLVLVHAAHINQPDQDDLEILEEPEVKEHLATSLPNRKFSYLSDIIERSHQGGSSHYFSSSAGRVTTHRDNNVLLPIAEPIDEQEASQKLSKFSTLQQKVHSGHRLLNLALDDFHRAVTEEKTQNLGDFGPQMSGISGGSDLTGVDALEGENSTSGDPYAKWILFFAIIVILVLFSSEARDLLSVKKKGVRRRSHRQKKPL